MIRWATALKWLALGFMAASFSASAQQQLTEGKQFLRLKNAQAVESGSKIEVLEFFSYGCIHCYHFEEFIGPWSKKVPADVSFKRIPVAFQPAWVNLGKIMYTLEAMGRDDLTIKVFKSIHDANVRLHEEKVFFEWAGSNGLDLAKVKEMWGSFAVNSKMNRAKTLAQNYQVDSTPMVFVDGKFRPVFGPGSIEFKDAGAALDFLVAKARSERKK
ncbi:MAG TPA: thiol:disulfide interchange protein DsbA/DsbL [Casimicrobium sp.]|nr:thiol:disulfide interchange protein DsbA/DsbL [Casimicrobium sp.]